MHAPLRRPLVRCAALLALGLAGCSRQAGPPAAQAPADSAAAPVATAAVALDPTGTWVTDTLPAADAPGRLVTLTLAAGGGAHLVTEYVGKGAAPPDSGRWAVSGDSLSIAWMLHTGRRLRDPMVWRHGGDALTPLVWDRAALGASGLSFHRAPVNP